ncbi:MAG: adenosylcobalamin-dependent ribonucleoside-diphosphate reductase [Hyphomicrobiaceae bacterium]
MHPDPFQLVPISREIWKAKYRFSYPGTRLGETAVPATMIGTSHDTAKGTARETYEDLVGETIQETIQETWARVAASAADGESQDLSRWRSKFESMLADFIFLPAGRILAGAGTGRDVTLFNCFVMGEIGDDLGAIFDGVKEAALTMQQGGGIGHDFSTLRPRGAAVESIGADASGPVSFMDVWDAMCQTIMSAGARRGAMMATLRCDHPDIEAFVAAKSQTGRLTNFNLSVLVTDDFIEAVRKSADWDLVFGGRVWRTVKARALWDRIARATYDYAEPGVIFIDRVNANNNLGYCEEIRCTNPCGEQPLPPYGACLLGSINLARLVSSPFSNSATLRLADLEEYTRTAVRFLDNIVDVSNYPLPAQRDEATAKRRIGLGVTGLADALVMLGERYGSPGALKHASDWMKTIQNAAYQSSAELAAEKGTFPLCDRSALLRARNIQRLDQSTRNSITRHGLRNGCLTSIAPTGTISLLAGNVSSGIEPIFASSFARRVLQPDGSSRTETVSDYAVALFRHTTGVNAELPSAFVTTEELTTQAHLDTQAAVQPYVDSSISKTINCPPDITFDAFKNVYMEAYELGLKGCTTFRPNDVTGSVLSTERTASDTDGPQTFGSAARDTQDGPPPNWTSSASRLFASAPLVGAAAASIGASSDGSLANNSTSIDNAAANLDRAASRSITDDSNVLSDGNTTPSGQAAAENSFQMATSSPLQRTADQGIVMLTKPLERDVALPGFTYKLKWPGSPDAIYVTLNDIEHDGRRRPFEIFINTKNLEHYAWTVALTRMISAVFRRGGDVSFVVEELKAIFDPQGGRWLNGRYVPSLLAAIGEVIESHMIRTGFLRDCQTPSSTEPQLTAAEPISEANSPIPSSQNNVRATADKACPQCGAAGLIRQEGCWICRNCGYSRCG